MEEKGRQTFHTSIYFHHTILPSYTAFIYFHYHHNYNDNDLPYLHILPAYYTLMAPHPKILPLENTS